MNQLILGDCLDRLGDIPPESVDLIYIDPPFNSNRNYAVVVKTGETYEERVAAFRDVWKGGSDTYIDYMRERVLAAWSEMNYKE